MNSRSVGDNLVNFSTDLATTLNQLDTKEPLLTFPFDHLYACSDTGDQRSTLHLKEVEISTHCVLPQEKLLNQRLALLENQNKKLKDLLIYHLDLIQQQNDLMSKKEKAFQALRQENDTLKSRVSQAGVERRVSGQNVLVPPPLYVPVTATITSAYKSVLPSSTLQKSTFNTFNEFLFEDQTTAPVPYLYNPNLTTSKPLDIYALDRPSAAVSPELRNYYTTDLNVPSLLEISPLTTEVSSPFTMIDNKRPKRKTKAVEAKTEPKYTISTNSGNTKVSRNRKRSTGIGRLSRTSKSKEKAASKIDKSLIYDDFFNLNKQSKVYGKPTKLKKYGYTSLQERLQLIEPTPTGEDPYQIGEAEMREQSPIPRLMLPKNQARLRMQNSESAPKVTSTITSSTATRCIYGTMSSATLSFPEEMEDPFSTTIFINKKDIDDDTFDEEQDVDVEKTSDNDVDWCVSPEKKPKETSLCDFSYGETSANLVNLDITKMEFPDFFEPGPVNADSSVVEDTVSTQQAAPKPKKQRARTTSLAGPATEAKSAEPKRATETKRARKRANSTASPIKRQDSVQQKAPPKRARRAPRPKKSPVPGKTTKKEYSTCMGDPDISWYMGIDPDIKKEDCDPTDNTSANVEVPRWRIMQYSAIFDEGDAENLDDKLFEKRHQKLEAEERRQLRWHLRRMREQRQVERLRQRQRDPWCPSTAQPQPRGDYTVWPQPIRDLQYIEITDVLPVNAFGEEMPDINDAHFVVPWVRTPKPPKASKRAKRAKTLH